MHQDGVCSEEDKFDMSALNARIEKVKVISARMRAILCERLCMVWLNAWFWCGFRVGA